MIKAVLFDMDGVLIDAKDWHYEALNRALALFGKAIDRDAHLATYDGLPTRRKLEILTKSKGLPVGLHPFLNDLKQSYTIELAHALCKPNFIHQRTLSRLKLDGLKLAVCSNSVRSSIELMMRLSKLDQYIDLIISNQDVSRAKPDPEMYETAMARFGLPPENCLILEDNEHGIAAAQASKGHLMVVGSVSDVTYEKVATLITAINERD
ncbi:HAD family hydrolase [Methylosinus sp. R-45379]|jgi:HAD superfamily hydrolase (TIGR01509 family)|uniref:HAD family hydrolase n=1 Tax=unclassified Methylosinus TaxID=2624500 RepID=UPI00047BB3BB|nr:MULTISPECIES: HAD family phosphatase [unclassified Methylosinus]OAI30939.1 HAD family hydrolase [Methylosinus sp. R-45379]TDX66705.1 HAD superfamily hydrolase (TIGR01493 family)/HAD superfamily hydrolase (TIGR01509 family)/HAD superfamily hydrolase (TIGR01549 family) [Methylosinus sp. sav-2]